CFLALVAFVTFTGAVNKAAVSHLCRLFPVLLPHSHTSLFSRSPDRHTHPHKRTHTNPHTPSHAHISSSIWPYKNLMEGAISHLLCVLVTTAITQPALHNYGNNPIAPYLAGAPELFSHWIGCS